MAAKSILQTSGTVLTIILSFVTLYLADYNQRMDVTYDSTMNILEFGLLSSTIILMILTGFSYYNSRHEHDGLHYILYVCVGFVHVILAPIAVIIASMKIDFGEYWWAVLIGIITLIIWSNTNKR